MGPLAKLMLLLRREAPAQAEVVREALRRSAESGMEHAVVGPAKQADVRSRIVRGTEQEVQPSKADRERALQSGQPVLDFHTHPAAPRRTSVVGVAPSPQDVSYYGWYYPDRDLYPSVGELRSLIAAPPSRPDRTSYHFFSTDQPSRVFDTQAFDDATRELQYAANRGRLRSVMDDPLFRDYFEYNGAGDLMQDIAPLVLLSRRAEQGRGRQEFMLPQQPMGFNPESSPAEFYRRAEPTMLDILREKKFARGGLAQAKECSCHG